MKSAVPYTTPDRGRKRLLAVPLFGAAVLVLAGACSSSSKPSQASTGNHAAASSASGTPIHIAVVSDLTGSDSGFGLPDIGGIQGAVKAINASGGVDGHPIVTQSYDTQSNPTQGEAAVLQAVSSHPTVVTGQIISTVLTAAASAVSASQLPWVEAGAPVTGVQNDPDWFTVSPTANGVAAGPVNGLKTLFGGSLAGKTIAIAGLNAPAVDQEIAAARALVTQDGGKIGDVIRDPISFTSWTSQAARMAASKPDGIIIIHTEPDAQIVAKALGVAGMTVPMVSVEASSSDALLSAVDSPHFYAVRETGSAIPGTKLYAAATAAGVASSQANNAYFSKGFADMYVIADTLQKCGVTCSTSAFASTLKSLGTITVPDNAMTPLNFGNGQSGVTSGQLWGWDASTGTSVAKSSAFPISN